MRNFFPPAICDGFNFHAIVDYVRRDQCHTRAARLHQRSPVYYLGSAFLIRIQLFLQHPPRFQYLRDHNRYTVARSCIQ